MSLKQKFQFCFLHSSIAPLLRPQIVGEIKPARDAVVEVTSRLRSYLYRDFFQRDTVPPSAPLSNVEASSSNTIAPITETSTTYQNVQTVAAAVMSAKVFFLTQVEC